MQGSSEDNGMMYTILYEAWQKEKTTTEIQAIPDDFYERLAAYITSIRRESRMLDATSTKSKLISRELRNVQKLAEELLQTRLRKANNLHSRNWNTDEGLASEERDIFLKMQETFSDSQSLLKQILHGTKKRSKQNPREQRQTPKRTMVRFTKGTPEFIGVDLKPYGPFEPEDVATLPKESAKVLMQQHIVEEVETS
jgi:DNA replication initiation complex subunit (GINS family)